MHCGHLPWQGAHTTNQNRDNLSINYQVSTPSAEMAGSWWFQHVPTDSKCQGRSILLHWNLLKKERLLPGWRRGKRLHWITWITATDGTSYPDLRHGRTQVAIKMKPQGGCECSTRGWYTNDMPRAWCMSMIVNVCIHCASILLLSFIETWRNCRCVIYKAIIQNHRCVGIMSLASSWSKLIYQVWATQH